MMKGQPPQGRRLIRGVAGSFHFVVNRHGVVLNSEIKLSRNLQAAKNGKCVLFNLWELENKAQGLPTVDD